MPRRNRPKGSRRETEAEREGPPREAAERAACARKTRFATEREADDAAYRARIEGTILGIYRCTWCDGWHLTSLT